MSTQTPGPVEADAAPSAGPGSSFALPRRTPLPSFDRCCGGKSLNDGSPAACGRTVTHYPHPLDREPGAS